MTIPEIEAIIKKAAKDYYNGAESMPDSEYDALIAQLKILDPDNPLCANGLASEEDGEDDVKVKHDLITGTLAKCADRAALEEWLGNKTAEEYELSMKIDGSGIELIFKDGEFVQAITRGNGETGLDRTRTLSKIQFPKSISGGFTGSVRAEMVIYNTDFDERFNDKANPRNAVAGIINRKFDSLTVTQIEDLDYIHVVAYDVLGKDFVKQSDLTDWLRNGEFEVPFTMVVSRNDIVNIADELRTKLPENIKNGTLKYNCDGIVIKQNQIDRDDRQRKTPLNDVALKPELEQAVSEIIDIEWSLSGKILSPVVIVKPVQLEGTTVQRASVGNLSIMMEKGIEIGKMAVIAKHGQIIPYVEKVL